MIDLDRLPKLRLVVARYGEMHIAPAGGIPKACSGATAPLRSPAGSAHAPFRPGPCRLQNREVSLPGALRRSRLRVTLWRLPADIEDRFDEHWHAWLYPHYEAGTYRLSPE